MMENINDVIIRYCKSKGRNEACGLVVERGEFLNFMPCDNIAKDRKNSFLISPDNYLIASMSGKVKAVVHSHPGDDQCNHLSSADRICQYKHPTEWWLVHSGEVKKYPAIPNLKGREFKEGYLDCYDSFRDFYRLAGLEMKDYSPNDGFRIPDWHKAEGVSSPFTDNIESEGFIQVSSLSDLIPGDVIFSLLGSHIPNHASVYVGENKIFHHLPGKLSGVETLREYFIKFRHSIWRYHDVSKLNINAALEILRNE